MKSVNEISDEALRLIERIINNECPTLSCPEKQQQNLWKRDQVRQAIAGKLLGVVKGPGPAQIK